MEKKLKIASLNVNSVRARLELVLSWLQKEQPDILCLQETKVQDENFPKESFLTLGYNPFFHGRKSYNGVAILAKEKPNSIKVGLDEWGEQGEARLIATDWQDFSVINVYVPQGREPGTDYFAYKLDWLRNLRQYLDRYYNPEKRLVCLGDFNVAPGELDVYDHSRLLGRVGHHPDEMEAFSYLKEWGMEDIFRYHNPSDQQYTFWDYRVVNALKRGMGWRIDHILATKSLAEKSLKCWIDTSLREETKPSDHTVIIAEFLLD